MTDTPIIPNADGVQTEEDPRNQLVDTLDALLRISNYVGSVMMLDDILNEIVNITSELMRVPICSVYLLEPDDRQLVMRSNTGFEPELIGSARFNIGEGIPGWVVKNKQSIVLEDARSDSRYKPLESAIELNCKAYLCSPLWRQDTIIGVMTARRTDTYSFSHDDVLFFETVCKMVAIVIEKAQMYEEKSKAERLATVAVSLAGVAHYIKNVMLTMQGAEYLVEEGLKHDNKDMTREGWAVLKRSNKKIRSLVGNILNYNRQEERERRRISINALLEDVIDSAQNNARLNSVALIPELVRNGGEVLADEDALHDVFLNLIANAIDAQKDQTGGMVWVRSQMLSGRKQIEVQIQDAGTGIAPENMDKIFNLFFSTKGKEGTGIGLAASKKIIEEHNGWIEVESKPGEGALFRIFLPVDIRGEGSIE